MRSRVLIPQSLTPWRYPDCRRGKRIQMDDANGRSALTPKMIGLRVSFQILELALARQVSC